MIQGVLPFLFGPPLGHRPDLGAPPGNRPDLGAPPGNRPDRYAWLFPRHENKYMWTLPLNEIHAKDNKLVCPHSLRLHENNDIILRTSPFPPNQSLFQVRVRIERNGKYFYYKNVQK